MDEESTRLKPEEPEPAVEVNRLRTEIAATRHELGTYISELDRRRHEALDLKLQFQKHPGVVIGAGVAMAAAVAGAIAMVVRARRQEIQNVPWAPWRIAGPPSLASTERSRMLKFLLRSAIPIGIGVARGVLGQKRTIYKSA